MGRCSDNLAILGFIWYAAFRDESVLICFCGRDRVGECLFCYFYAVLVGEANSELAMPHRIFSAPRLCFFVVHIRPVCRGSIRCGFMSGCPFDETNGGNLFRPFQRNNLLDIFRALLVLMA